MTDDRWQKSETGSRRSETALEVGGRGEEPVACVYTLMERIQNRAMGFGPVVRIIHYNRHAQPILRKRCVGTAVWKGETHRVW